MCDPFGPPWSCLVNDITCSEGPRACLPLGPSGGVIEGVLSSVFADYGEPCTVGHLCDPGPCDPGATNVPGCDDPGGCCTAWCDLSSPDPNGACPDAAQGQFCASVFEAGAAPPSLEHVGWCVMP